MEHREVYDKLQQAGFTRWEIYQLERIRRQYAAEQDRLHELATHRRLQFMRYLVTTGKLTEQVA